MVKIINIDTKTKTIHISNADGDIKTWRTTESGTHFPIREGESTKEALDKFVEKKRPEAKKENPNSWTMGDGTKIEVKGDWVIRTDKNGQKSRISKKEWESLDDYGDAESGPLTREPSWQPTDKEPKPTERDDDWYSDESYVKRTGVTQKYIELADERDGLKHEILMARRRGRTEEEAQLREEQKKVESAMAEEGKRIDEIKKKQTEKQQPADTPKPGITWNLTEKQKKEFAEAEAKEAQKRTKEDDQLDDLHYNYGTDDDKDLMKAIEEHYVNQVAFYGKDSRDAEQAMRDYRKVGRYLGQEPKSHDEIMQGRTIEFEPDLPEKSETADWPKSPKFEKLTEQYMPKQGEADNQLGEMLRSINRVVYRYYNDGDMWNKGYGKETVNQAIKHLTELAKNKETPRRIARGLDNALYELKKYGTKDKDRYETALKIMMQTVEWADQSDIDALSKMKAGKKEPASKPMSADHIKQTMQKTMESFPKLYSWEKPHLEKFADDIWSELEKNPGKEQEVLDEWVEAYDDAAKRLGMWVDTPTLVKRDFVKKVAESWKSNSGTQGQQPAKTASAPEKSESTGDVSGSYPELGGVQQALWDAGYIMDNYDDGEFGDTGTEYVWKDGTMYAVDITKNPDGSVSAKQSSMGEVSESEYAKYLDEIHADDDDDEEEEDDEEDSDISGIESRGEAANWLNAMTRKHGNTYFWSGNMKSALNKLVEKFGNTYFWNK